MVPGQFEYHLKQSTSGCLEMRDGGLRLRLDPPQKASQIARAEKSNSEIS
jgi:hypothetical protein